MDNISNYEEYADSKAAEYAHKLVERYGERTQISDRVVFDEKGLTHLLKRVIMEGVRFAIELNDKEDSKIL